jgi:hypothetical protein
MMKDGPSSCRPQLYLVFVFSSKGCKRHRANGESALSIPRHPQCPQPVLSISLTVTKICMPKNDVSRAYARALSGILGEWFSKSNTGRGRASMTRVGMHRSWREMLHRKEGIIASAVPLVSNQKWERPVARLRTGL